MCRKHGHKREINFLCCFVSFTRQICCVMSYRYNTQHIWKVYLPPLIFNTNTYAMKFTKKSFIYIHKVFFYLLFIFLTGQESFSPRPVLIPILEKKIPNRLRQTSKVPIFAIPLPLLACHKHFLTQMTH